MNPVNFVQVHGIYSMPPVHFLYQVQHLGAVIIQISQNGNVRTRIVRISGPYEKFRKILRSLWNHFALRLLLEESAASQKE